MLRSSGCWKRILSVFSSGFKDCLHGWCEKKTLKPQTTLFESTFLLLRSLAILACSWLHYVNGRKKATLFLSSFKRKMKRNQDSAKKFSISFSSFKKEQKERRWLEISIDVLCTIKYMRLVVGPVCNIPGKEGERSRFFLVEDADRPFTSFKVQRTFLFSYRAKRGCSSKRQFGYKKEKEKTLLSFLPFAISFVLFILTPPPLCYAMCHCRPKLSFCDNFHSDSKKDLNFNFFIPVTITNLLLSF